MVSMQETQHILLASTVLPHRVEVARLWFLVVWVALSGLASRLIPPFAPNLFLLHTRLIASLYARGQNTAPSSSGWAGATPGNFGRLKAGESGVAPTQHGVLAASNCSSFLYASASFVRTSLWARDDAKGDPHRVTPVLLRR